MPGVVWNKIFRMGCIRSHRFIEDRKVIEDQLFSLQVGLEAENFYFIDRAFVFYRQRYDSLVRENDFSIKLIREREMCLRYVSGFSEAHVEDIKKYICCRAINNIIVASKNIPIFADNFIYLSQFLYNIKSIIYSMFESKEISADDYKFVKFIISLHESDIPVDKAINYLFLYNINVANEKLNILTKKIQNLEVAQSKINIMSEHIKMVHEMNKFSLFKYVKYRILSKITMGKMRERYKLKYKELKKVYKRLKK